MTLCDACGKLPAAMQLGESHVCIMCAMQSDDPAVTRQIREMGLTETELKRMRKTVTGAETDTPAAVESPAAFPMTGIEGIDVVSPAFPQEMPRFRLLSSQPYGDRIILIFQDTQTGVQYITNDDLTGFSPLLNADGKPLTTC